ncbi:MAG: T9SS type A sorting domain-containing protein, partial [Chloroherpetonaceae bacterium]
IEGGSDVTFTATGATTVTLTGFGSSAGNALNINSGQLTLGGSAAITLDILSGNTGRIADRLQFTGTAHRLTSVDSASVVFENGSEMIAALGFAGNAFGTTNLNSVIFQDGSTYRLQAGANPFGATQPNSVVIFQSGSTYIQESTSGFAGSGRTYGNLTFNLTGTLSPVGASPLTIAGTLTKDNTNTVNLNLTGGINIGGNLVSNDGTLAFNPSSSSTITFNGTSAQVITAGSGTLTFDTNAAVTLNNPNGLVLNRAVTLQNTLTLTNGLLTTNNNLTLTSAASVAGGNDNSYIVGSLAQEYTNTLTTRLYPFGSFGRYRPISIRANTSSGTGTLRGQLFDSDANSRESITDPPNRVSTVRYYGFQATGSSLTVDQIPVLRANVDDGIGSFLSNTTLRVATARSGTGWTLRNLDSPPNTTTLPLDLSSETGLGFSVNLAPDSALFALGSTSNTDNPLPVELLAYTGKSTSDGAVLLWQTASEIDNLGFTILKDGVEIASFTHTPSLRGRGTTSEETRYQFIDSKVKVGDVHQYTLRQTDFNGTVHDLGTITLDITTAVAPHEYSLSQNYPNPFNPTTTITYALKASGEVKLELFDVLGRKVATLVNARQDAGSYTLPLNAARYGLSTGMYFYRLQSGGFVATKKMLLVK